MKSNRNDADRDATRMELKYCEHGGGLWVRERGAGTVYCDGCQPRVADLPAPKKKPGRITLPVQAPSVVDDYQEEDWDEEEVEFEAAGGVA